MFNPCLEKIGIPLALPMASICGKASLAFHGHPDLVRRSVPVSGHSGSLGVLLPSTSSLLSLPHFPRLWPRPQTGFLPLFPSSGSWNGNFCPTTWVTWMNLPTQAEVSWCRVDPAPWQGLIRPAPRRHVPCLCICIWTYPAIDQAQECPPMCKYQSLKWVPFLQTLFLLCPGSSSSPYKATVTR